MSSFNRKSRFIGRTKPENNWLEEIAYPAIAEFFALQKSNMRVYFIPEKGNKMYEKIALTPVETDARRYQLMSSYIKNLIDIHGILFMYADKEGAPSESYIMVCNKSTNYNLTLFTGSKCKALEEKLSGATSNATKPGQNSYPAIDLKKVFEDYARRLNYAKTMS